MVDAQELCRFLDARPDSPKVPLAEERKAMFRLTFMCGRARKLKTKAISRSDARLKATSCAAEEDAAGAWQLEPAIILSVVVLPQPEGPSRQKKDLSDGEAQVLHRGEFAELLLPDSVPNFRHGLIRKFRNDDEHDRPEQVTAKE